MDAAWIGMDWKWWSADSPGRQGDTLLGLKTSRVHLDLPL